MTEPAFETYEETRARDRKDEAEARANRAIDERDKARDELAKVKRDIGWMMGHGLIADYVMQSDTIPAGTAHILVEDEQDTARLRWLNEHGRVSLGNGRFVVSFPHGIDVENQEIPDPYNIRHLLDLCRKFMPILLLLICGCGSIESTPREPVTILWPTEKFTNNYAAEYLWPQNMQWWAFEAGFGSDGRVYWRTNTEYDRIFGEFWDARDKAGLDR